MHNEIEEKSKEYLWPKSTISSPWPDKIKSKKLIQSLEIDIKEGLPSHQFYVTQCVLTPRVSTIVSSFSQVAPKSLRKLAFRNNRDIFDWLFSLPLNSNLNIIIVDHYHYFYDSFMGGILKINIKNFTNNNNNDNINNNNNNNNNNINTNTNNGDHENDFNINVKMYQKRNNKHSNIKNNNKNDNNDNDNNAQ